MPSPFPGMDPFIEGQIWEDFHREWISEMRHQLLPLLRPKYVPRVELRVYIERVDSPPKSIAPDIYVTSEAAKPRRSSNGVGAAAAVAEPYLVQLPEFEEREEAYLGIYDAESREVVTVIELLSPGNKRGGQRRPPRVSCEARCGSGLVRQFGGARSAPRRRADADAVAIAAG